MTVYYLDTSALIKRYRTETGTAVIGVLFSGRREDDVFTTSHFTSLEVESVAARALKARLLDRRAHGVMLRLFAEDLEQWLVVLPLFTALVSNAAELVRRYAIRAGDSIHLASALRVREAVSVETVFVTSDGELLQAAEAAGFSVLNPEADNALETLRRFR